MKKTSNTTANGYVIESGIPIPSKHSAPIKSTLEAMKKGDSVLVPLRSRASFIATASSHKIKVATRAISETEARIWRVE